ncbi:hypothetical protein RIR_jg5704.t1 [Rhizophagus irregularis DAOM 181602=DAOM 197198]|nr:hypothetical protein RIR_jg5704.t1 [Rhizophagus irregularis DAOM 181602=DAOM 197198]
MSCNNKMSRKSHLIKTIPNCSGFLCLQKKLLINKAYASSLLNHLIITNSCMKYSKIENWEKTLVNLRILEKWMTVFYTLLLKYPNSTRNSQS